MTDIKQCEHYLGELAMAFRGTLDPKKRTSIAQEYAKTVATLIGTSIWEDIPPPEDTLPDDWMPAEFFQYCSPSIRQGKTGPVSRPEVRRSTQRRCSMTVSSRPSLVIGLTS